MDPVYSAGQAANKGSPPEKPIDDVTGMTPAAAKEYIFGFLATIKLNEKEIAHLEAEAGKWRKRIDLAHSGGEPDLALEAERRAAETNNTLASLKAETAILKTQVKKMTAQLPGLAARERSVDPDVLMQEILIAAGLNPGDEDNLKQEKIFSGLEKNAAADKALAAMKAKLAGTAGNTP
ncbi:MAG: chromosome partitioning protein [Treponema sp.]|jgi:phage shock protein A|nr:chromosome partitioning protein [Treponema sp.]